MKEKEELENMELKMSFLKESPETIRQLPIVW